MKHSRRGAGHDAGRRQGRALRSGIFAGAVALAFGTGCEVVNPGPVEDAFLTQPESQQAYVNGAGRKLVEAVNNLGYTGALVAREIFPGGQTGAHGHDVLVQGGYIQPGTFGGHWGHVSQARYVAESALARFAADNVTVPNKILFEAHNWAGYANRVAGEHYCEAVIDGGELQPGKTWFTRAEGHFTSALTKAETDAQKNQALAGRAQVRLWLRDFQGAAADAKAVLDNNANFKFALNMDNTIVETRNMIFWANADQPYRAFSVRHTFYDDYYTQTGDPRVRWALNPQRPNANANLQGYGPVPFRNQMKYTGPNDDVNLATAREMRLILAEIDLENGDWNAAMTKINALRTSTNSFTTGLPLQAYTATDLNDAWRYLKRERGIELWLEGRRMGDLRRWEDNNTPGDVELPNFEQHSAIFSAYPRSRCFDIPNSERERNPHLPVVH